MDLDSMNQYKHRRLFSGFYHILELRIGRLALKHAPAAARTFAGRLLSGEINPGFRLFLPALRGLLLPLLKLETNLAVLTEHEERFERAAVSFRNEFVQQVGFAGGQQLLKLRGCDRLLEDD